MSDHDSPTRLTVAQWAEWARLCKRDGRDDLMRICLSEAANRASESEKSLAEILLEGEPTWTS